MYKEKESKQITRNIENLDDITITMHRKVFLLTEHLKISSVGSRY